MESYLPVIWAAIIGCAVDKPAPLAQALGRPRHIIRIDARLDAVRAVLRE